MNFKSSEKEYKQILETLKSLSEGKTCSDKIFFVYILINLRPWCVAIGPFTANEQQVYSNEGAKRAFTFPKKNLSVGNWKPNRVLPFGEKFNLGDFWQKI